MIFASLDRSAINKAARRGNDFDAKAGESFNGIVWCNRCDNALYMVVHGAWIDQRIDGRYAKRARGAHQMGALARR